MASRNTRRGKRDTASTDVESLNFQEIEKLISKAIETPVSEGFTTAQMREATGKTVEMCRRLIKEGLKQGTLKRTRIKMLTMAGFEVAVPAYALV